MQKKNKFIYLVLALIFFVFVDFYLSNLIVEKVSDGSLYSNAFVNFVYVKNTGAAFSILQNSTILLILFALFAIGIILYFIIKNIENMATLEIMGFAMLLAGIIGNFTERVYLGFVRDFFDLTFIPFPIFNVSDVFINIGVFVIIILILLDKKPIKFL